MSFPEFQASLFQLALLSSALLCAGTLTAIAIGRRQTGNTLHVVRGSRRLRVVAVLLCGLVAVVVLSSETADSISALCALGLAALTAWVAPGLEDMVLGRDGVRRGWQARSFDQLEGWRLEGQHLRFLVHGELVAVEVPREHMAPVNELLLERRPEQQNTLGLVRAGDTPQG
jgi:hypothetical protein